MDTPYKKLANMNAEGMKLKVLQLSLIIRVFNNLYGCHHSPQWSSLPKFTFTYSAKQDKSVFPT